MRKFSLLYFFACYTSILSILQSLGGCANIISPSGGPKDSLPPVLVLALPKDSALNVSTNKFSLTFDEFVEVKNIQENLIVSPYPKLTPVVDSKLRTVTIKMKDSLESNTTYSLNFGESIKDVNEGNIAKAFTYVFSTGNHIDNYTISGKVLLAETGKVDSTLLVFLHRNLEDSAIYKLRPRYLTRLDGNGRFVFRNLPKGSFSIFVLPNDYSKKYDDSTKLFAFGDKPIQTDSFSSSIVLYAYQAYKKQSKSVTNLPTNPSKSTKDKVPKLTYTTSLENNQQDLTKPIITFQFSSKISTLNIKDIVLSDTNFQPLKDYKVLLDSSKTTVTIQNKWLSGMPLIVVISKDALSDSSGNKLSKSDTIRFLVRKETDYGSVKIRIPNIKLDKNPVLQIVENDAVISSFRIISKELKIPLFKPGEYEMRLLYDQNRNMIWDAGNFNLKKQPEVVESLPGKLRVKADWDNETTINL